MKVYKSIAFASLVIGTVLCIVGFFMNGISELPDETQKLSKYVTIRSFGKARNVSMEMRVDDSCDLSLELSAVNGTIKYYDGEGMENSVWTEVSPGHFAMLPDGRKGCSI